MSHPSADHLGADLVYTGVFPLVCTVLEAEPEAAQLAAWNATNERILRQAALLEDGAGERADDGAPVPDWARLETKLNYLLELVGRLVQQQLALPVACPLRLTSGGIEWQGSVPADSGAWVLVGLYLFPVQMEPLHLPGRLSAARQGHVTMAFAGLGEEVQDRLDKLIFRHHRRCLAQARSTRFR